ncbi:MAG: sterol desaturase family protein [Sphingomonadaceae bacterium]
MSVWLGLVVMIATIVAMEGVAYASHRWIMHGPGWFLHKSHHRPRTGRFEANDWYAAIFALPSMLLFLWGIGFGKGDIYAWIGAGIAAYGAIYFGFHDVIVHKRIAHRYLPGSDYMKRIVQAHRLHHVTETKHGAVSFGFIWAPRPEVLKAELARRGHEGVREPRGAAERRTA